MNTNYQLGVDTGGTFTDFVLLVNNKMTTHKVLSTPDDPSRAILTGINDMRLSDAVASGRLFVIHGSTVATNAALERKGVRTAYVANKGLKDVLTLARQTRPELYNLTPDPVEPPVPDILCLEVDCRLDSKGNEIKSLEDEDIDQLIAKLKDLEPEAVAINLLFSFLDDAHEKRIESALPNTLFVSRSSFVLPEYKEYERGIATWLNSWLGPRVDRYLARLASELKGCSVSMMQSSGGTIDVSQAAKRTVNLLLSGPAGGLAATRFVGDMINETRFITFDMGGTSTDVALVDGHIRLTNEGEIGPWPVAVPMVDMHTIGAGGGSLVWIDKGGMLQVGPESAGASPGPACYGQGGQKPTVTDANVVLGRLQPGSFLGGGMSLDVDAAECVMKRMADTIGMTIQETASGVIDIANEHMTRALRSISIQRGYNPSQFRLCCFGGAGGLHVCGVADAMGMKKAIVPIHGGVLSALGMLVAPRERQLSKTHVQLLSETNETQLLQMFDEMAKKGRHELEEENVEPETIVANYSVDLRYKGQSFTLNLPWASASQLVEGFHELHKARYGHSMSRTVEMVNVRVAVTSPPHSFTLAPAESGCGKPQGEVSVFGYSQLVPVYAREDLRVAESLCGPLLIVEKVSTTMVEVGWTVTRDQHGNLLLDRNDVK